MSAFILIGALVIDLTVGEPPVPLHPVVWMGALIDLFVSHAPRGSVGRWLWGFLLLVLGVALSFGLTWLVLTFLRQLFPPAAIVAGVLLLKVTFAAGALGKHAGAVRGCLERGELDKARAAAQFMVSRRTTTLTPRQIMASTIESVAENTLDSIVAPLFWFLLLGVPGAMAYRFVNTADAMVGYRGEYEHLGKTAARLDDALNWIPARFTFLLLVGGSWLAGLKARHAWLVGRQFHDATESPNAGWTMSAAAGALSVPLEKVGHYRLGDDPVSNLIPRKIGDVVALMYATTFLAVALFAALEVWTPLGRLPWALG